MSIINLPSYDDCLELLDKYGRTSEERYKGIKAHSIMVAKVAVFLAKRLSDAGEAVIVNLVERAALLHDIDKVKSIKDPSINHAIEAGKTLKKLGYPEIALIARKHVRQFINDCNTWEEKLLLYVDSRVNFNAVVSIRDKDRALLERYKDSFRDISAEIKLARPTMEKIEKEIFSKIDLKPEDLAKYVK